MRRLLAILVLGAILVWAGAGAYLRPLTACGGSPGIDIAWDEASSTIRINGRVYVKSAGTRLDKGLADWLNTLVITGVLVNDTDKEVTDISLRCTTVDSNGTQWTVHSTLQGRLKANGSVSLELLEQINDKTVTGFAEPECEVMHSSYGGA